MHAHAWNRYDCGQLREHSLYLNRLVLTCSRQESPFFALRRSAIGGHHKSLHWLPVDSLEKVCTSPEEGGGGGQLTYCRKSPRLQLDSHCLEIANWPNSRRHACTSLRPRQLM